MSRILLLTLIIFISYTSNAQEWVQLGDTPFGVHHSNGFGVGDIAYVIQGQPNTSGEDFGRNNLWEYDSNSDSWTKIGIFPGGGRSFPIGDNWNGKYYFGFGVNQGNYFNDLWEFDPTDQSFTQLPSCPCDGRAHPALIAHNDKIFMGTGSSSIGDRQDWWEYDMGTQEWTRKENMPGGDRHHPFFFGIDDKVYAGGGHLRNWLSWDMITEEWTPIDDEPDGRVAGSQLNHGGKGYLIGGDDRFHASIPDDESFMSFDPETGEWSKLPPLPEGSRWAPSSFIINDQIYFFGGETNGFIDTKVFKFDLDHLNCLPAENLNAINITDSSADLFWLSNTDAASDTLLWRKVGETEWNREPNPQATFSLPGLESCTEYEYTISSVCDGLASEAQKMTFRTTGCGSCVDFEYCDIASGLSGWSYIDAVFLNGFANESGNNDGYGEFVFEGGGDPFYTGQSFDLSVIPGFTGNPLVLNLIVWIDYNANGMFEESEKVVEEPDVETGFTTSITIPQDAEIGTTRLRILYGFDGVTSPCAESSLTFGEAEDYCIDIEFLSSTELELDEQILNIYPNPFTNSFTVESSLSNNKNYQMVVRNLMGQVVHTVANYTINETVNLPEVSAGVYLVELMDETNKGEVIRLIKQ